MGAVLLAVVAGVWFAFAALGAPAPPVPTIVNASKPTNPTMSQSAAFQYTDSVSVTFQCSLDGSSFASCGSGTSGSQPYSGLAAGSHTFQVRAVSGGTSAAASYTWVIDRTPPTASVTFPASGGVYKASSYSAGCTPAGLCGSAADPSGVASVRVSVKQNSTGKWWNGSSFSPGSETFVSVTALGTPGGTSTSWRYTLALPPDDTYLLHVQATDSLGNAQTGSTYAATASFTIDTVPPGSPSITAPAASPAWITTTSPNASWTGAEVGGSFLCNLDGSGWLACSSPKGYSGLAQGTHTFQVEQVDAAGNVGTARRSFQIDSIAPNTPTLTVKPPDPSDTQTAHFEWTDTDPAPASGIVQYLCSQENGAFQACGSGNSGSITWVIANPNISQHQFAVEAVDAAGNVSQAVSYKWKVQKNVGQSFVIGVKNTIGLLTPNGPDVKLNLVFTNPNPSPITINSLDIAVTGTDNANCSLLLAKVTVSQAFTGPVGPIPAGSTGTSLSDLGVNPNLWPRLHMADNGNQDNCKGIHVTLSFTNGQATG